MKIGVLGTGMVGNAVAGKLVELGHEVRMGSRSAANDKGVAWAEQAGEHASEGPFADAAAFGEIVFNLVESKLMSKTEEDCRTDFHAIYDLDEALVHGFRIQITEAE